MKKTLIVTLTLVEALFIFLAYNSYKSNNVVLDDVKLKEDVKVDKKAFALMIQQSDGTYEESESNTFPTDMVFNKTKSGCIDEKGNPIANSLDYEDSKVVVTTNRTSYCYLYFDLDNSGLAKLSSLATTLNDTSKISKYTGPVTDECSASSCTTVQQAQNVYIVKSNDINNVIFEGYCWKIIRTTETGGMKLLYNGVPTTVDDHQECVAENGENASIVQTIVAFNDISDSPAYVGYMYNKTSGTLREMLYGVTQEEVANETYGAGVYTEATNVNLLDSTLKSTIESWFRDTSNIHEEKLEDAVFCNDRRLDANSPYNALDETYEYIDTNQYIYFYNYNPTNTLECANQTDSFSKSNLKAQINYKVGFMTEAERNLIDKSSAKSGQRYWLGTPRYYIKTGAIVRSVGTDGGSNYVNANNPRYVRPVVSASSSVQILSGDGSTASPFIAN